MPRDIFILGLDELNLETLGALPDADRYRFHQLLTIEELQQRDDIPLADLIEKAERQLRAFDGTVDAIVGYWDFPISSMVPILAERFGVRAAPLESVAKCEHKYWSRLEQQKVTSEIARFAAVDPFDPESVEAIDLQLQDRQPLHRRQRRRGAEGEVRTVRRQARHRDRRGVVRSGAPPDAVGV